MGEESGLGIIRNGAVAVKREKIVWVGDTDRIPDDFRVESGRD